MIGRVFQRLVFRVFGAYRVDEVMLAGMLEAIEEEGQRMARRAEG